MVETQQVEQAIQNAIKQFSERIANINKVSTALKKVEDGTGLNLCTYYNKLEDPSFSVERRDIAKIRRVVGRMKVTYRDVPYDYDSTHELIIHIKPSAKEFDMLTFSYRTPHRGGKCHVETNVSKYQTLVCER